MAIDVQSFLIDYSHGCTSSKDLELIDRRYGFPAIMRVGCNHRFNEDCPICADRWRKKNLRNFKRKIATYRQPRFLTLTTRYDKATLQGRTISELWELRKELFKRLAVLGYHIPRWIAVLESTTLGVFNHIHIVYDGPYLDQAFLTEMWKDVTVDSFKVDIRYVDQQRSTSISWYLSKYLSKLAHICGSQSLSGAHLVGSHGNASLPAEPFIIRYMDSFEVGFDGWKRARPIDDFEGLKEEWKAPINRFTELTTHQTILSSFGSARSDVCHSPRYCIWIQDKDVDNKPLFRLTPMHFINLP